MYSNNCFIYNLTFVIGQQGQQCHWNSKWFNIIRSRPCYTYVWHWFLLNRWNHLNIWFKEWHRFKRFKKQTLIKMTLKITTRRQMLVFNVCRPNKSTYSCHRCWTQSLSAIKPGYSFKMIQMCFIALVINWH